ncbi:MAG: hypothetical protein V7765_06995 [Oleispira sp.]
MTIPPALLFTTLLIFAVPSWSVGIKVSDSRANNFYMDALTWVLNKSGADYYLVNTDHSRSSQVRKVALVQRGELDVMYAGTTIEMEEQLQPIRFPITRGLIGSRILIINNKYKKEYGEIKDINDLKKYIGILSFGWPEKEVFEAVGLAQTEKVYNEIFESINAGSRYYFSRGILEAYSELIDKQEGMPRLMVEQNILLKYKSSVLFFINPNNKKLAKILNTGFRKGYEDGSYKEFLYNHPLIKASFEKAKIDQRMVIEIPNPFFPKETGAIPAEYWH